MPDDMRWWFGTADHWKIEALCQTLGESAFRCLVRLWEYIGKNRPDGSLRGMREDAIEGAARWPGERGLFLATLVNVGLLDGIAHDFRIHGWDSRQPHLIECIEKAKAGSAGGARSAEIRRMKYGSAQPTRWPKHRSESASTVRDETDQDGHPPMRQTAGDLGPSERRPNGLRTEPRSTVRKVLRTFGAISEEKRSVDGRIGAQLRNSTERSEAPPKHRPKPSHPDPESGSEETDRHGDLVRNDDAIKASTAIPAGSVSSLSKPSAVGLDSAGGAL